MNVVEILITAKDLAGPAMKQVDAQVEKTSASMKTFHKTAMLGAAGLTLIAAESVKMAAKFDSSMTLLHTQAGVAQSKIAGLKSGVLALAGKVGQDPDSLAESLFHVESNFESMGISSQKALHLVETAAKGATTGHAKLVDVTNALTAAVASGIPGVQNMDQAMGVLNATVGVGDMKMQDLANAFGSGMVATVKGFGLNIADVGAALAVFGDNNIRGSLAGNQLRMSVMALAHPVATAGDALNKLGLTQTTLATDMQKGGLKLALEDLVDRMHKAGVSSKEQGQIITEAFGRKAGAGLNVLVSQMDRLESKYPALEKGAKNFGQAWADTQKTFAFQMKALQASFDALMISIGEKIIPPLQSFVGLMLQHKTATIAVTGALAGMLAATVAVSAAMKVAAATSMLWAAGGKAVAALSGVFETVALKAMYVQGAFAAAGGGVAGLKAAFMELGAVGKASVVVAGVAALALVLTKLSNIGKKAPPDIDRMTTALTKLGDTGKVSGEALRVYGSNLGGLADSLRTLARPSDLDKTQQFLTSLIGMDSTPVAKAKENLDAVDQSLTNMVTGGKADLAKVAFSDIAAAMEKQGLSAGELKGKLSGYTGALASQAEEQKLTAQSMGLFGQKAVETQAALDLEAKAAEGLEQSIMALNAVHRGAYDAETAFYQAISDATKAVKANGRTLDEHTDSGRKNRDVLSQLAAKTEDLVDKKMKEKTSWDQVDKVYKQGRKSLIDTAIAMGDTKKEAQALANELLKAPPAKKLKVSVDKKAAESDLNAFNAAVKRAPGKKSVTLSALSGAAEKVLEAFGYKVTHLKNGSVRVTAATSGALSGIQNVAGALNSLNGKTATTYVITKTSTSNAGTVFHEGGKYADGGPVTGGSGTQDDVPILAMGGEFMVRKGPAQKHRQLLQAINEDRLPHFAKGGPVKLTAAQKAERAAEGQLRSEFGISYFGKLAGYQRTPFEHGLAAPSDIGGLVQALNKAAGEIKAATHGRTETHLLKELDSVGKSLIKHEQALNKVTSSLDAAKSKLDNLKSSAAQLSDSVKGGLLSSANITQGAAGQTVTVASIMGGLTQSRDQTTAFAGALKGLQSKGLSKDLIQQIAEAGVNGGGLETAGALLGASSSEISSVNSLQSQISKGATAAGKVTSDAVYGAALKAQEKLVNNLKHQQAKLEKAMDHLAKVMENAISKAVGKKASGGIVGAAASGGVRGGLTWVGEHEPELLDLPVGSRVLSGPDSRRMAAGMGASPAPIVIQLKLGDRDFGEVWVDTGRREVRARGGLEATLRPPRGR